MTEQFSPQDHIHIWKASMMPPSELTPQAEYKRSLEEMAELDHEITVFDGSLQARQRVIGEAGDMAIRLYGIADAVGMDLDVAVQQKVLFTTERKYPSGVIKGRMEQGNTWRQAMALQKSWSERWNKHL